MGVCIAISTIPPSHYHVLRIVIVNAFSAEPEMIRLEILFRNSVWSLVSFLTLTIAVCFEALVVYRASTSDVLTKGL